ncbi:MAG TPA: kelch repeat-containing protein [Terriglobia bacterium]
MNTQKVARLFTNTLSRLLIAGLAAATAVPALAQAPGTWAYTGSMPVARRFHTATLFNNGQVLVLGGYIATGGGATASADLYDPSTGTWTPAGTLENEIYGHTATLLVNGEVLVTGGIALDSIKVLKAAELYDPSTEASSYTGGMTMARVNHSVVRLPNGQVLVAGGFTRLASSGISGQSSTNAAEVYNPTTGTFTATGSMNYARANAPLTLLPNGEALIAGGGDGRDNASCTAELFSNGQWRLTSPLPVCGVSTNTAALLPNGDVLIDAGSASQFYDPSTNVWEPTLGAADINVGPLTLLANGEVLVAGVTPAGAPAGPGSSAAALYDPSTNEWTSTGSLKQSLSGLTLTPLLNGQALAAGGKLSSAENDAELFTP